MFRDLCSAVRRTDKICFSRYRGNKKRPAVIWSDRGEYDPVANRRDDMLMAQ